MQESHRTRNGDRYRLAFIVSCFVMLADYELTGAAAQTQHFIPQLQDVQHVTAIKSDSCLVEIYAYLKVRGLAEELGRDGDILDFALDDLRAGLIDCLDPGRSASKSELFDHATPVDERAPVLRVLNYLVPIEAAHALRGPKPGTAV